MKKDNKKYLILKLKIFSLKVGLYRTRFATLVKVKLTKPVFRGRALYERL